MNNDLLKDWSINQATRFLIYKANTPDEEVYTDLTNKQGLITIYCMLAAVDGLVKNQSMIIIFQ